MFDYLRTAGEKTKLERLYLRYRGVMFLAANKILNNKQDAEDAVHQAFVKIADNLEKTADVDCPKTRGYLVTIVENQAIDMYRKKSRHALIPFNEECMKLPVEYDGDNQLAACMAGLPVHYRQALVLRYYHGYEVSEIAQIMEISPDYASKLIYRAKKRLEALCKEAQIL